MKSNNKTQKAFTLVEVIIVVAILGIVLQIVATILVTIMRQQTAIIRFGDVKKEGDQILARIKSEIQTKAKNTYNDTAPGTEICTSASATNMLGEYFSKKTGGYFAINRVLPNLPTTPGKITFIDVTAGTTIDLSSKKVNITGVTFECVKLGTYANKLIAIDFDIQATTNLMIAEGNPKLHYSTKVLIKD